MTASIHYLFPVFLKLLTFQTQEYSKIHQNVSATSSGNPKIAFEIARQN